VTIIAGVSLLNGVMLLADSRVTVTRQGEDGHFDVAQKLLPIASWMAIGFSGDVAAAAFIIPQILHSSRKLRRADPITLLRWLPRVTRKLYSIFARMHGHRQIHFMIGATMRDRPNIVERSKVAEIVTSIATKQGTWHRDCVPDVFMRVLMTPPEVKTVRIDGTARGILATMAAPDFELREYPSLTFCTIGSGGGASREIAAEADWIIAGDPFSDFMAMMGLTDAVGRFVGSTDLDSVGGMYPCIKLDLRGLACLGHVYGTDSVKLALTFDSQQKRWIQTNRTTGKRIELRCPWEIDSAQLIGNQRFDDWLEARHRFLAKRPANSSTTGDDVLSE